MVRFGSIETGALREGAVAKRDKTTVTWNEFLVLSLHKQMHWIEKRLITREESVEKRSRGRTRK